MKEESQDVWEISRTTCPFPRTCIYHSDGSLVDCHSKMNYLIPKLFLRKVGAGGGPSFLHSHHVKMLTPFCLLGAAIILQSQVVKLADSFLLRFCKQNCSLPYKSFLIWNSKFPNRELQDSGLFGLLPDLA